MMQLQSPTSDRHSKMSLWKNGEMAKHAEEEEEENKMNFFDRFLDDAEDSQKLLLIQKKIRVTAIVNKLYNMQVGTYLY